MNATIGTPGTILCIAIVAVVGNTAFWVIWHLTGIRAKRRAQPRSTHEACFITEGETREWETITASYRNNAAEGSTP
jgi:hypothetical protein